MSNKKIIVMIVLYLISMGLIFWYVYNLPDDGCDQTEVIESLTRQNEKLIYSNSELANQLDEMIKERSE